MDERKGAGDFINSELWRSQYVPQRSTNLCCTVIYANIFKLYTHKVYGKILMSCEDVYQKRRTLDNQVTCKKVLFNGDKGEIGGYAYANSVELLDNMIVLCDPFFRDGQELLLPLITRLRSNKAYQKDPHQMNGKTRALLHEITHLAAMSETDDSKRLPITPTVIHITNSRISGCEGSAATHRSH